MLRVEPKKQYVIIIIIIIMSRFVKREINSPQMRSVVVLILCTYFWIYFWIYLRPPRCSNSTPFFFLGGGGRWVYWGGQAPPGVRVILTLLASIPSSTLRLRGKFGDDWQNGLWNLEEEEEEFTLQEHKSVDRLKSFRAGFITAKYPFCDLLIRRSRCAVI